MKVIVVTNRFDTATTTFVRDQTHGLGADVLALDPASQGRGPAESYVLPADGLWAGCLGRIERGLGWRILGHYTFLSLTPMRSRALAEILRGGGYDVALLQFGPVALACAPVCYRLGLPFVIHFHGLDLSGYLRDERYTRALRQWVPKSAGCVVPVASFAKRLGDLCALPSSRTSTIPYGVEAAYRTRPVAELCRAFVYVGRLVEKKDPLATLAAFVAGTEEFANARLTFIGDGPLRGELEAEVDRLNARAKVSLLGEKSHAEVKRFLITQDSYLQLNRRSSSGDEEGSPVAVSEASAAGLPVVSTLHAGIPDRIVAGRSGLLVEPGNWRSAAKAVHRIASEPGFGRELGAYGQLYTRQHFSHESAIGKLRDALARFSTTNVHR